MKYHVLLAYVSLTAAEYTDFFFSSNGSCPGLELSSEPIKCLPQTQVCAKDALLDKYYCCEGEEQNVCWSGPTECYGSNRGPSSSQVGCKGTGDTSWCCRASEECTQRTNQNYICWSKQKDVLGDVSNEQLRALYTSLSSKHPSASTLKFDATSLAEAATATSSSTTAASKSPSTAVSSSGQATTSSLSTGAIAGIAVGSVIGGIGVIAMVWFVCIKRRRSEQEPQNKAEFTSHPSAQMASFDQKDGHPHEYNHDAGWGGQKPYAVLPSTAERAEIFSRPSQPRELP